MSRDSAHTANSVAPQAAQTSREFDIDATKQWFDTNVDLRAGEKLSIAATGQIRYPASQSSKSQSRQTFGPDGLTRGWKDLIHEYAVRNGRRLRSPSAKSRYWSSDGQLFRNRIEEVLNAVTKRRNVELSGIDFSLCAS